MRDLFVVNAASIWFLGVAAPVLGLAVFALLALANEIGFRFGRRRAAMIAAVDDVDHTVTATLTSGMIGLLAFILGLTINFAENRFEARRDLVVTEANAIGAAWHGARILGSPQGELIADRIRQFAQTRLEFTRARSEGSIAALNARTSEDEIEIWRLASEVARASPTPITATLINALSEMFDSAQAQRSAFLGEAPSSMIDMMMLGAIIAIGAMGYETGLRGSRQPVLTSLLLLMWAGGMVIVLDLSNARQGSIVVDSRPLVWTIGEMDQARRVSPAVLPIGDGRGH